MLIIMKSPVAVPKSNRAGAPPLGIVLGMDRPVLFRVTVTASVRDVLLATRTLSRLDSGAPRPDRGKAAACLPVTRNSPAATPAATSPLRSARRRPTVDCPEPGTAGS